MKIQQYMYMYFIIILNSFRCFSLIFPSLLKQFRATLDRYMCKADALAKPVLSMTLEKRWRISGGAQMNLRPVHISCLMSSHFYRKHLQERRLTVTSVASIDKVIVYFTAYDKNFTDLKTVENNKFFSFCFMTINSWIKTRCLANYFFLIKVNCDQIQSMETPFVHNGTPLLEENKKFLHIHNM